jgi:hypothetical protein
MPRSVGREAIDFKCEVEIVAARKGLLMDRQMEIQNPEMAA